MFCDLPPDYPEEDFIDCPVCEGAGKKYSIGRYSKCLGHIEQHVISIDCSNCWGTGKVRKDEEDKTPKDR